MERFRTYAYPAEKIEVRNVKWAEQYTQKRQFPVPTLVSDQMLSLCTDYTRYRV